MGIFDWSTDKNVMLKRSRGIGFEDIVGAINDGHLLTILAHPNSQRYPHQKVYIVLVHDYVYAVPFVENNGVYFLKTIYPSRKYTKRYLTKGK